MPSPSPFARSRPAAVALLLLMLALAERPVGGAGGAGGAVTADAPAPASGPATPTPVRRVAAVVPGPAAIGDLVAPAPPDLAPADPAPPAADTLPPHPVQHVTLAVDGAEVALAYLDVSPPLFTGRTAVLLHGRLAGDRAWAPTIAALGAAGFRVVVPDLPGVGRSAPPPAPLDAAALAAHVERLLEAVDARAVTVVAHGAGAAVALELAAASPRVRRLVLARPEAEPPAAPPVPTLVVDAGAAEPRLPGLLVGLLDR